MENVSCMPIKMRWSGPGFHGSGKREIGGGGAEFEGARPRSILILEESFQGTTISRADDSNLALQEYRALNTHSQFPELIEELRERSLHE